MSRSLQWKLIAGFLLVFIAGATTGAFFGASHARRMFFQPRHGMIAEHMRDRLQKELSLTPEQMTKISPIIDKTATQLEQIRQETGQRVHGLMTDAHREIATNLNDEQRAKLKDMEARFRRWHERRRGFHHGHSPEPQTSE